jgi:signal peptidase I
MTLRLGGFIRFFWQPSASMEPTIHEGDRFVAWTQQPSTFARGDIVLVDAGRTGIWAKRVVGLPGDDIQMVDGIVYLNGRPVPQRLLEANVRLPHSLRPARRLSEQLPGEAGPHQIYDLEVSPQDELESQRIAPGHLFLMGDNRDDSVDSRMPPTEPMGGLGQVRFEQIVGVPWFYYSWQRLGEAAGH